MIDNEEEFQSFTRSLGLPQEIAFTPPPNFEGVDFHLNIRFKDLKDLPACLKRLQDAFSSSKIQEEFSNFLRDI
jgi:hypothetical protein